MLGIKDIDVLLPPRYEPNGETIDIVAAIRSGAWMGTVNIMMYRIGSSGNVEVLFQQRDTASPTSPGLLDVSVAGYLHAGYDPLRGILAEVKEELGVDLDPSRVIHMGRHLAAVLDHRGRERKLVANNFIYEFNEDPSSIVLHPDEVPAIFWIDAHDFLSLESGRTIAIKGISNGGKAVAMNVDKSSFVYNVNDYHYRTVERIVWRTSTVA